jgi:membrane-bound serine protease (ClpP class)
VPGALGASSLLLALYAFSVLPVNLVGVLLLIAGIASFIAEAVIVSHGLLTVAGLIGFVFGSVMLVETPLPGRGISLWLVLPSALTVGMVMIALLSRALRARRMPAPVGADALVGAQAEVVVPLTPRGKIFVQGEYWDAVAETEAPRGAWVRVTAAEPGLLHVEGLGAAG